MKYLKAKMKKIKRINNIKWLRGNILTIFSQINENIVDILLFKC